MESEKLMPCPFCGSEVEIVRIGGGWFWRHIDGYDSGCTITWRRKYETKEEAENAWNRRIADDHK